MPKTLLEMLFENPKHSISNKEAKHKIEPYLLHIFNQGNFTNQSRRNQIIEYSQLTPNENFSKNTRSHIFHYFN